MHKVTKAVILAAGRGTRMGTLTEDLPKPMLPVGGRPILWHILNELREAGIRETALVVGYRREMIEEYFRRYEMPLTYLLQEVPQGTAAAARLARNFAGSDDFILTFGDILCNSPDYTGLCAELQSDVAAVVGVRRVDDPWRGAAVYEQNGDVTRIIEKPPQGTSTTNWNSAGLYAFTPDVFDELDAVPLSSRGEYELTSAVSQLLEKQRRLRLYEIRDVWRDVGTPEDLQAAQSLVDRLRES